MKARLVHIAAVFGVVLGFLVVVQGEAFAAAPSAVQTGGCMWLASGNETCPVFGGSSTAGDLVLVGVFAACSSLPTISGMAEVDTTGVVSGYSYSLFEEQGTSINPTYGGPCPVAMRGEEWQNLSWSIADESTISYGAVASTESVGVTMDSTAGDELAITFWGANEGGTTTGCAPLTLQSYVDVSGRSEVSSDCYGELASSGATENLVTGSAFTWFGAITQSFSIQPDGSGPVGGTTTTTGGGGGGTTTSTTDADGGSQALTGSSSGSGCDYFDPECWFSYLVEPSSSAVNELTSTAQGSWVSNWSSNIGSIGSLAGTLVGGGYSDYSDGCESVCPGGAGGYGGVAGGRYCILDDGQVPAEVVDGQLDLAGSLGNLSGGEDAFGGPADLCYYEHAVMSTPYAGTIFPYLQDVVTIGVIVFTLIAALRMVTRFMQSGT